MAKIIIPPRGVGAGVTETSGKYLAYVDTAIYINAKNVSVELPEAAAADVDRARQQYEAVQRKEPEVRAIARVLAKRDGWIEELDKIIGGHTA